MERWHSVKEEENINLSTPNLVINFHLRMCRTVLTIKLSHLILEEEWGRQRCSTQPVVSVMIKQIGNNLGQKIFSHFQRSYSFRW